MGLTIPGAERLSRSGGLAPRQAVLQRCARQILPGARSACRMQCLVTTLADGEAFSENTAGRAVSGREAVGRVRGTGAAAGAGRGVRSGEFPAGSGRREAEAPAGGGASGGATARLGKDAFEGRGPGEAESAQARDRAAKPPAREVGVDDRSGAAGASGTERRRESGGGGEGAGHRARAGGEPGQNDEEGPAGAVLKSPVAAIGNRLPAARPGNGCPMRR